MREILFKAKRNDKNEWVTGHFTMNVNSGNAYITCHLCGGAHPFRVDPETVCQYTGVKDRSGNRIFEGDIVRVCLDPEIEEGVVKYKDDIACFTVDFKDGFITFLDHEISKKEVGDWVWIEVIGNIHDKEE